MVQICTFLDLVHNSINDRKMHSPNTLLFADTVEVMIKTYMVVFLAAISINYSAARQCMHNGDPNDVSKWKATLCIRTCMTGYVKWFLIRAGCSWCSPQE